MVEEEEGVSPATTLFFLRIHEEALSPPEKEDSVVERPPLPLLPLLMSDGAGDGDSVDERWTSPRGDLDPLPRFS